MQFAVNGLQFTRSMSIMTSKLESRVSNWYSRHQNLPSTEDEYGDRDNNYYYITAQSIVGTCSH